MDDAEPLEDIPLFRRTTAADRAALHELMVPVHVTVGSAVVAEGDVGTDLFIVVDGEVVVSATGPSGEQLHLNRLGPGDFFGELGLLGSARRTASVTAATDIRLLRLHKADYITHLSQTASPDLAAAAVQRATAHSNALSAATGATVDVVLDRLLDHE